MSIKVIIVGTLAFIEIGVMNWGIFMNVCMFVCLLVHNTIFTNWRARFFGYCTNVPSLCKRDL